MQHAIVVGGSNGIGLALSDLLIQKQYLVTIFDRVEPSATALSEGQYRFVACDLRYLDPDIFEPYASDPELGVVFISAGLGRIADFEAHHPAEIQKMMTVNATAELQIIRMFYDRLLKDSDFFLGIMGSISGLLSSPMAAVYAASKAAVCRFTESVNIELEIKGSPNRILNVSPGSFKGSRFYGGENDLSQLNDLANDILDHLFHRNTLFIPDYDETFHAVAY